MEKKLKKLYAEIENLKPFGAEETAEKEVILRFLRESTDVLLRKNRLAHLTTSAWIVNP